MARNIVESESSGEESDIASEENDGSSEGASPSHALIDLEAAEASSESSTLGDENEEDEDEKYETVPLFPRFGELPLELRLRIWELFSPDLQTEGRVISFNTQWHASHEHDWQGHWRFDDGMALKDQTESLRRVSSVHRETRDLVTKAYPDTLRIHAGSGDAEVRFNKERDIVFIHGPIHSEPLYAAYDDGFCNYVRHVAFDWDEPSTEFAERLVYFLRAMPVVETVYLSNPHDRLFKSDMQWCGSRKMRHAHVETYEKSHGLGEDLEWTFCWPRLTHRWDETTRSVMERFEEHVSQQLSEDFERKGIKLGPMIVFEFDSGRKLFEEFVEEHDRGKFSVDENDEGESSDQISEEENEYESEGIDDAEIVSQYSSSEDEIVPQAISVGSSSDAGELSPVQEEEVVAAFSSPEPENEAERDQGEPSTRPPKRRIVSDSDDEDDEPTSKKARTDRTVVVSSDDDDDDDAPRGASQRSRSGRVAQVISSDSEEDETAPSKSNDSNSSSQEEESEEDDQPASRPSLAERLSLFRKENPINSDREDDSGDEGSGGDDSLINDEDEDEEDQDEDALIDDMAEDSEGEGEDGSEDGW